MTHTATRRNPNIASRLEVMRKKLERMDVAQKLAFRFKMAGVKELSTRNFVHWHKRLDYSDCSASELAMYVKPSKEFINKVINFFYGR